MNQPCSWQRRNRPAFESYPQRGIASILITLITMLVITLIVLGFAVVSRREQRQSLDQQLSVQAFYAAESAVEDARKIIEKTLADPRKALVDKDRCLENNAGGAYPTAGEMEIDPDNDVSYTCLKVDSSPASAIYEGISENNTIVPIKTTQPIERLELTWRPSGNPQGKPSDDCPANINKAFSPQPDWSCGYGVLRTDLVPTGTVSGNLTRPNLIRDTMAGFFVPVRSNSGGEVSYATGKGQPNITAADCGGNSPTYTRCKMTITELGGGNEFSLRLNSIYRASNVSIVAYQSGGDPLELSGAQIVVDATGKAQDVLRRIQVRLPIEANRSPVTSSYAIQSNASLCKRFRTSKTYFDVPSGIQDPDPTNDMCRLQ